MWKEVCEGGGFEKTPENDKDSFNAEFVRPSLNLIPAKFLLLTKLIFNSTCQECDASFTRVRFYFLERGFVWNLVSFL